MRPAHTPIAWEVLSAHLDELPVSGQPGTGSAETNGTLRRLLEDLLLLREIAQSEPLPPFEDRLSEESVARLWEALRAELGTPPPQRGAGTSLEPLFVGAVGLTVILAAAGLLWWAWPTLQEWPSPPPVPTAEVAISPAAPSPVSSPSPAEAPASGNGSSASGSQPGEPPPSLSGSPPAETVPRTPEEASPQRSGLPWLVVVRRGEEELFRTPLTPKLEWNGEAEGLQFTVTLQQEAPGRWKLSSRYQIAGQESAQATLERTIVLDKETRMREYRIAQPWDPGPRWKLVLIPLAPEGE